MAFLSGYRKPKEDDVLFVWQVAVLPSLRGQGIAQALIQWVLTSFPKHHPVRFVEASVTTSNRASFALFEALASKLNTTCSRSILFSREDFGSQSHEDEWLLRIGPISKGEVKSS